MSNRDYNLGWNERGQAEAALKQWYSSQGSPLFTKCFAIFVGIVGMLLIGYGLEAVIDYGQWTGLAVSILGMLFVTALIIAPSVLRDEARKREEAKATLQRLGVWDRMQRKKMRAKDASLGLKEAVQAEFNDLVRKAHDAQETFDSWDEGKAYTPGPFGGLRLCTLEEVVGEWNEANRKLIEFTLKHGKVLLKEYDNEQ